MRNFSKYLSMTALTGLISVGAAMNVSAATNLDATQLMDMNGIAKVRVAGADTRVTFTADPALPTGVTVLDHGGKNCQMTATMTREGDAMLISFDLQQTGFGFGFFGKCDPNVAVNLAVGTNLDIALQKVVAQINGQYASLNVETNDAVINFDGQANHVNVDGEKVVATVVLNNSETTDLVRINAPKLVVDLGFAANASVAYQINAAVSLFNRGIAEASNAKTRIEISSDVLKGSTYVDSSAL